MFCKVFHVSDLSLTGWRGTCSSRRHTGCWCAPAARPSATDSGSEPRAPGAAGSSLAPHAQSDTEDHHLQTPPAASSAHGSPEHTFNQTRAISQHHHHSRITASTTHTRSEKRYSSGTHSTDQK